MKAVILLSGLAGLAIFGPPVLRSRAHHHEVSVIVHELSHNRSSWDGQSECPFEAERIVRSPAGSVEGLRLLAGSGSLAVVGVEGLQEIQGVGRACASHEDFLGELQLTSEMAGSTLVIETHYPDLSGIGGGNRYARLDLRIEVPAGLAADIQDGSGEMTLSDLGSITVKDGSGGMAINGIRGGLTIEDGSGDIVVKNVGGDFTVERDGSGGIRYEAVGGSVNIPKKKRER